jgi:hypothetical protein
VRGLAAVAAIAPQPSATAAAAGDEGGKQAGAFAAALAFRRLAAGFGALRLGTLLVRARVFGALLILARAVGAPRFAAGRHGVAEAGLAVARAIVEATLGLGPALVPASIVPTGLIPARSRVAGGHVAGGHVAGGSTARGLIPG